VRFVFRPAGGYNRVIPSGLKDIDQWDVKAASFYKVFLTLARIIYSESGLAYSRVRALISRSDACLTRRRALCFSACGGYNRVIPSGLKDMINGLSKPRVFIKFF
jgi:hypothetical protein